MRGEEEEEEEEEEEDGEACCSYPRLTWEIMTRR